MTADDSRRNSRGAASCGSSLDMQDLLWIVITLGLLAATFAYARLCDSA